MVKTKDRMYAELREVDNSGIWKKLTVKQKNKLFDKRDNFPFQIVRMPHYHSNIPFFTFYGTIFSEFLRIARCSSNVNDFVYRAHLLKRRMTSQGGAESMILKQIRKLQHRYPECLQKFGITLENLLNAVKTGVLVEDSVVGDS